jgi:hypothetical protein
MGALRLPNEILQLQPEVVRTTVEAHVGAYTHCIPSIATAIVIKDMADHSWGEMVRERVNGLGWTEWTPLGKKVYCLL